MTVNKIISLQEQIGGTPFYVYQEALIRQNIDRFKSISYQPISIYFASMANDNPILLKMLQEEGFNIFVNSRKHLHLAFSCGFQPHQIIFASTGISKATMELLIKLKIQINIDSLNQLMLYGTLNPGGAVGIRLNIDEKSKNNIFIGTESRIGIMEAEIKEALAIADRYQLKLTGTHVYLGTNVIEYSDLVEGINKTLALSDYFPDLNFVDFGGGFPVEEEKFDFNRYSDFITERMSAYSLKRGRTIQLILEPGRAMFGNTASFYAQVTDIKTRPDHYLVCVNASATLIPRAMFYEDYNPVSTINQNEEVFDKPVDVVGNTTYSRDFMAKKINLPCVNIGDWLRFDLAGSYCYSMITSFLGQELPSEYLISNDNHIKTIRSAESYF
jgi:diaminopimelate decarboxylase